jgi:uncharacterized repeat protein (TIGR04076 family)
MDFEIEQLPCDKTCPYHLDKKGKVYHIEEILPYKVCPWLYNSVYPYFLGLLYGARFKSNAEGDCNVCCPAANGVDTIVKLRPNDGSFDPRISKEMKFVIFAEVVKVHGDCPSGHKVGQRIPFPTCMKGRYMCPAAFHNVFSLMTLDLPPCIDRDNLRCPDWANPIPLRVR